MIISEELNKIKYRVIYSRRRTLAISIHPDGDVIVRVPLRTTDKAIRNLVSGKSVWILRHTNNFRIERDKRGETTYTDGSQLSLIGRNITLRIELSGKPGYRFCEGILTVGTTDTNNIEAIKVILTHFYKRQARAIFPGFVNKTVDRVAAYGLKPSALKIRTMRKRWGSCTSKGSITLNSELIRFPEQYLEYVILHELCHLKHHNHGEGFYRLLAEVCPNWKRLRGEMKKFIM